MIKQAVILAAGRGTRLRPITAVVPKEMLPLIDTPVIQYVIEEALLPGIEEILVVTNKKKAALVSYLTDEMPEELREKLKNVRISIAYQEDHTPEYGTGAALMAAEAHVSTRPFLLLFGDSFALFEDRRLEEMTSLFEKVNAPVVSLIPVTPEKFSTYGIPQLEPLEKGTYRVRAIIEKPGHRADLLPIAAPGGYILTEGLFDYLRDTLKDEKGERSFVPAFNAYCREQSAYGTLFNGMFFETGNPADYLKAIVDMSSRRKDIAGI